VIPIRKGDHVEGKNLPKIVIEFSLPKTCYQFSLPKMLKVDFYQISLSIGFTY
jgi:hypothetical protein